MLVPFTDSRTAWLLLRTKPKQEHNVVHVLNHRVLDVYCPHVLEPRGHARAPVGPVPLFPSYVFARCDVSSQYNTANYCPGVFGVVRFGEFLAAVEDEFVDLLRSREATSRSARCVNHRCGVSRPECWSARLQGTKVWWRGTCRPAIGSGCC
jgi:hypothetical protein